EVSMGIQSVEEVDDHPLCLRCLNRRQKIAVSSDDCRIGNLMLRGQKSEIHAHQNIYPFLLEYRRSLGVSPPELQSPLSNLEPWVLLKGRKEFLLLPEPFALLLRGILGLIREAVVEVRPQDLPPICKLLCEAAKVNFRRAELLPKNELHVG